MAAHKTIAEAWAETEARLPAGLDVDTVAAWRRMFYSGALAAVTAETPPPQILRELVDFGRTIGTAVERAR